MSDNEFKLWELEPNHRQIAEHIGMEAFNKLVWLCGGEYLYIPKADKKWMRERNRRLMADYNGENAKALAKKYSISQRRVQQIVNEMRREQ